VTSTGYVTLVIVVVAGNGLQYGGLFRGGDRVADE